MLVTGGGGFVGVHLTEVLAAGGERVVALDTQSFSFRGKNPGNVDIQVGDVTRFESLLELVKSKSITEIIAGAAITGSGRAAKIPLKTVEVNVLGVANTLECARIAGMKRIIHVSSNSVYGKRVDLRPIKESDPKNPDTVYRRSKLLGEGVCELYSQNYDVKVNMVRPGVIYGPRSPFKSNFTLMVHNAITKRRFYLPKGGDEQVDYVFVKDVAHGIASLYNLKTPAHSIYNLGSGESPKFLEIARTIKEILKDFDYEIGPGFLPGGGWLQGPLDVSLANRDLNYRPTPMKDALSDYIEWLKSNPDELNSLQEA